jgi:hypothetical protein
MHFNFKLPSFSKMERERVDGLAGQDFLVVGEGAAKFGA